ncbi:MAG TPA: SWIM zinc finger family protein, partial [Pseudomonadota bacterium]|nr:SWIM zinc finger family protein [Pseudomonadota bacterium]
SFTLGLSGWTANDWSASGNFDLMAPRADVDELTRRRVFDGLRESYLARPDALAERLGLDRAIVLGALSAYTQAGRAIFDLNKGVYRLRELSREPLPMDALRFANPREESATRFVVQYKSVRLSQNTVDAAGVLTLRGQVKDKEKRLDSSLIIDADERIIRGECACNFYQQNKLYKGPCEHMLALRMQHRRSLAGSAS